MWDRGLHSYGMVQATLATRCDYLGRVPKNVKFQLEKVLEDGSYLSLIAPDGKSKKKGGTKIQVRVIEYTIDTDESQQVYRLITSLTDIVLFPALLLATEYHRRWEVENTIDELKVHHRERKTLIRSQKPREVIQEVYGWLLGHWAVRSLMFQVADERESIKNEGSLQHRSLVPPTDNSKQGCPHFLGNIVDHANISPLRLGNTCTLNVVTPIVPKFQRIEPEEIPFFLLG